MSCKDVFTDEERRHLEEVLHGDLDGYHEELKDVGLDDDFIKWKKLSASILEKCGLNDWVIEREADKPKPTREERNRFWKKVEEAGKREKAYRNKIEDERFGVFEDG